MAAIGLKKTGEGVVFTTTHWSMVLAAGAESSPEADRALEDLCRTYWRPLYWFLRWRGVEIHDAEDMVQGFFAGLLSKEYLQAVDPRKGKFRSFLLASIQNFTANEWRHMRAQKRGGKVSFISLDDPSLLESEIMSADPNASPERNYERQWAMTLLRAVLAKLREEWKGKEPQFEALKPFLNGEEPPFSYAELAVRLNSTEAGVKMAVSRLRSRHRELLRAEVANTLADPSLVDEELRALCDALS